MMISNLLPNSFRQLEDGRFRFLLGSYNIILKSPPIKNPPQHIKAHFSSFIEQDLLISIFSNLP